MQVVSLGPFELHLGFNLQASHWQDLLDLSRLLTPCVVFLKCLLHVHLGRAALPVYHESLGRVGVRANVDVLVPGLLDVVFHRRL